ncbi:hypothetical protein [Streptomyces sp. NPDC014995]
MSTRTQATHAALPESIRTSYGPGGDRADEEVTGHGGTADAT